MTTVRTRFAPSPTGELHLGNARIAVLNWLFARHAGGSFVLRIEDTDLERNLPGAESEIASALRRLGIDWDEGPDIGGPHGPYHQSERTSVYRDRAERLLRSGAAYYCFCTQEQLDLKKEEARRRGERPGYDGTCRRLSQADVDRLRREGGKPSIRFNVPAGETLIQDAIRGEVRFGAEEFSDFVILKSDGLPTYNFAVVVDDSAMRISHVIRGAGHLANTPRQVMLYHALQEPVPQFVHVPHVLSPDGSPLSKRTGARSLRQYLDQGYHPDALINYLSLLSWSSPSGDEVLPPERLIAEIDLNRLGASDVRLDPDKLEWLSGEHIRRMTPEALTKRISEHLEDSELLRGERLAHVAAAIQERITTFTGANELLPQFRPPDPMRWSDAALEELEEWPEVPETLGAVRDALYGVEDWSGDVAMLAVRTAGQKVGIKGRRLFMPVRAAVSGATQGPELADIFEIQGKATTLRVLEQALAHLEASGGQGA